MKPVTCNENGTQKKKKSQSYQQRHVFKWSHPLTSDELIGLSQIENKPKQSRSRLIRSVFATPKSQNSKGPHFTVAETYALLEGVRGNFASMVGGFSSAKDGEVTNKGKYNI